MYVVLFRLCPVCTLFNVHLHELAGVAHNLKRIILPSVKGGSNACSLSVSVNVHVFHCVCLCLPVLSSWRSELVQPLCIYLMCVLVSTEQVCE